MKVIGYVDGMNVYEISKDKNWYPAGWCNWTETIKNYCPSASIEIRYFTTKAKGGPKARQQRQELHLRAMKEVAKAELVFGDQARRPLRCSECKAYLQCRCGCRERYVEKQTDVNIAIRLVEDAIDNKFDVAILVSADTDLIPAVRASLRRNVNARVVVLRPPDLVRSDLLEELSLEYPNRAFVEDLEVRRMVRFPDDLAQCWGIPFPRHWRADAGERPGNPDQRSAPPSQSQREPQWLRESMALGQAKQTSHK